MFKEKKALKSKQLSQFHFSSKTATEALAIWTGFPILVSFLFLFLQPQVNLEVTGEENHRGDEGLKEAAPERDREIVQVIKCD